MCLDDILPLVKSTNEEVASAISIIFLNLKSATNDFKTLQKRLESDMKAKFKGFENTKRDLEKEIERLKSELTETQKIKFEENRRIKAEVDEIFGDDDREYQLFKLKTKRLLDVKPTGAAEFLKEIYNEMNQERHIPVPKTFDGIICEPEELELGLRLQFSILQRTTAHRVIKLFDNKTISQVKETQTTESFVEQKVYDEAVKLAEKYNLLYHGSQHQEERFREEIKIKSNTIQSLETEKSQLNSDILKTKREIEAFVKEIETLKKEIEIYRKKLDESKIIIDGNMSKVALLETQIENQLVKLSRLSKPLSKVNDLEADTEEERLQQRDSTPNSQNRGENNKSSTRRDKSRASERNKMKSPRVLNSRSTISDKEEEYEDEQESYTPSQSRMTVKREQIRKMTETNSKFGDSEKDYDQKSGLKSPIRSFDKPSTASNNPKTQDVTEKIKNNLKIPAQKRQVSHAKVGGPDFETQEYSEEEGNNILSTGNTQKRQQKDRSIGEDKLYKSKDTTNPKHLNKESVTSSIENLDRETYHSKMGANGIEVVFVDRGLWTNDLKNENLLSNSVGVQYNWESPDIPAASETSNLYIFAYNPNNVFGLRGDTFYNKSSYTFNPHPRIPELQKSLVFQSNYVLDDKNKKIQ